jgi:hypothetical protein
MFFPFLVIVPGMIAAALHFDARQKLPHPAADCFRSENYAKAVDAVKSAIRRIRRRGEGRGDALGKKVGRTKLLRWLPPMPQANCPTIR